MNAKLSMENPDWISPVAVITAARMVMGSIDLDPMSDAEANAIVQATEFFDEDTDGLYVDGMGGRQWREWPGRVYLNPAGGLVKPAWVNFIRNYLLGHMTEGVWCGYSLEQFQSLQTVNFEQAGLETLGTKLLPQEYPHVVFKARLRFSENNARRESRMAMERVEINAAIAAGKKPKRKKPREQPTSPTHGNYLVYLGENVTRFAEVFGAFGKVVVPR